MSAYQTGFNVGATVGDAVNPYNTTCVRGAWDGLFDAFSERNMQAVKAAHAVAKQNASDARYAKKFNV